VIVIYNRFS